MWAVIDHKRTYRKLGIKKRYVMRLYQLKRHAMEWSDMRRIEIRKVRVEEV